CERRADQSRTRAQEALRGAGDLLGSRDAQLVSRPARYRRAVGAALVWRGREKHSLQPARDSRRGITPRCAAARRPLPPLLRTAGGASADALTRSQIVRTPSLVH